MTIVQGEAVAAAFGDPGAARDALTASANAPTRPRLLCEWAGEWGRASMRLYPYLCCDWKHIFAVVMGAKRRQGTSDWKHTFAESTVWNRNLTESTTLSLAQWLYSHA